MKLNNPNLRSPSLRDRVCWLALLFSLVAGMCCASRVEGQFATYAESGNLDQELVSQTVEFSDQRMVTRNRCGSTIPVCVSARDEVWLVSARNYDCQAHDLSHLQCSLLQEGAWNRTSLKELVSRHLTDKTRATMIYVHGNRTNLEFAKARGLQVYQTAFQNSPCPRPPIRFVVFAWKSETEIRRPLSDFSLKSVRAVDVGSSLAQLLNQFDDRNLAVMGFSLGSQVILSGLTCADQQEDSGIPGRFRVALIAPALDPDFVRRSLCQFSQNSLVERTSVFINRDDRAIKAAQLIVRRRSRSSITTLRQLAGFSQASLNPITINDITTEVSKKHSISRYSLSPTIRTRLAQMLFEVRDTAATSHAAPSIEPESGVFFPSEDVFRSESAESVGSDSALPVRWQSPWPALPIEESLPHWPVRWPAFWPAFWPALWPAS